MSDKWKPVIHWDQNVDVIAYCFDAMVCCVTCRTVKCVVLYRYDVLCYNSMICCVKTLLYVVL